MASIASGMGNGRASDLLRSSPGGSLSGTPLQLKSIGICRIMVAPGRRTGSGFTVCAKLRKVKKHEYPWPDDADPNVKGGVLSHLSPFKPLKEKQKPVTLEFEKPLVDLQKKIIEVQKMANETGLDFTDQIVLLENKYQQALKDLYTHLTPIQRVNIARHPNRPTFLDHVFSITDKFVELHGDRAGYDDPAIVTGIGTIDGERYMFMGHQKGRNTKENIQRNFGMPTPHGYRKALRMMYYADHHGFPIITFIDTPGAYADLKSEELGQGEAIAHNLRTMFGLKVPIVSIVIGEGGSGGALAIGCANKLLMLENAVFYVASPEACAAILWKSAKASPQAAEKLKITAPELCKLQIADGIIPEPLGGAHADPSWTSQQIKFAVVESMNELKKMNTEELLKHRMLKFRKLGGFQEGIPIDPKRKVNMKKKEEPLVGMISDKELEGEVENLKQQILKAKETSTESPDLGLNEMIQKLKREVGYEISEAVKAMGLDEKVVIVREQLTKSKSQDQIPDPATVDNVMQLRDEIKQGLPSAPNYSSLKNKVQMLIDLTRAKEEESVVSLNMKKKEEPLVGTISDKELEGEVENLKQQILKAKETSTEFPDLGLNEMIQKLKREVDYEISEAVRAMGLDEKVAIVREQLTKFKSQDQIPDPATVDNVIQLRDEIKQGLPSAPNYSSLKNKRQMLIDLTRAKEEERVVSLKREFGKKTEEILSRPDIKQKMVALQAELQNAGVTTIEELDQGLKEEILKVKRDVQAELKNFLESMGLKVEIVKSKRLTPDAVAKVKLLSEKLRLQIEDVMNASDLKKMIRTLDILEAMAGDMPSEETRERIKALKLLIAQNISENVKCDELWAEYEELKAEIDADNVTLGGTNGALGNGVPNEGNTWHGDARVEVNEGESHGLP